MTDIKEILKEIKAQKTKKDYELRPLSDVASENLEVFHKQQANRISNV